MTAIDVMLFASCVLNALLAVLLVDARASWVRWREVAAALREEKGLPRFLSQPAPSPKVQVEKLTALRLQIEARLRDLEERKKIGHEH